MKKMYLVEIYIDYGKGEELDAKSGVYAINPLEERLVDMVNVIGFVRMEITGGY